MLTLDKHPGMHHQPFATNGITEASKKIMYDTFQTWALKTYGDSGKTKTVTRRKHDRIIRIMTGEEEPSTENSKFRFWAKAKGFKLFPGLVDGIVQNVLFVPVKTAVLASKSGPLVMHASFLLKGGFEYNVRVQCPVVRL